MDDMTLIYNINLCRICQIPDKLDLISTSTTTVNGEKYLDLLKFIFNDIVWFEDQLVSLACKLCLEKIKNVANFKKLCLESNSRRSKLNAHPIKLEIETVKLEPEPQIPISDDDFNDDVPELLSPNEISVPRINRKANKEKQTKILKITTATNAKGCVEKKVETNAKTNDSAIESIEDDSDCHSIEMDNNDKETEEMDSIDIDSKVPLHTPRYIPLLHERTCRDCKTKFANLELLKEHISKNHLKLRRHYCEICQEGFKSKEVMERHVYKHSGIRNYVCTLCGSKYITHVDLNHHLLRHADEAKFVCNLCPDKKYKTQSSLRSHNILVHKESKGFLCTECGTTFSQTGALKLHMLRRHGNNRNFACASCEKTFYTMTDLKVHVARHANIKAYKCDLCAVDYNDKRSLLKHKARVHGIGQYKCRNLQKYECSYCSKIIAKDKFQRHIRTHTGVKPYKCRLCEQKFNCKSYIKGHVKGKHDIDVEASDYDTKAYYDVCEIFIQEEENSGVSLGIPQYVQQFF